MHPFVLWWAERTYKIVIFGVFLLQVWGITRFYLTVPHLGICTESVGFSVFFLFCDVMVFKGLYRTKDVDPGYMIPKKENLDELAKLSNASHQDHEEDDDRFRTTSTCARCGFERSHNRVSHCGRCNRCVDYMDHHCYFTDNCIGKQNFRFFLHFILWSELSLVLGFLLMLANIYTRNVALELGAQGLFEAICHSPIFLPSKYMLGYDIFNLVELDGLLVSYMTGLIALVTAPGFSTI